MDLYAWFADVFVNVFVFVYGAVFCCLELEHAFWTAIAKYFDTDKSGEIDPAEYSAMMNCIDPTMDDSQLAELVPPASVRGVLRCECMIVSVGVSGG